MDPQLKADHAHSAEPRALDETPPESESDDVIDPTHSWWSGVVQHVLGADAFISYGSEDARPYAKRLARAMIARGLTIFLDRKDLSPATILAKELDAAVSRAKTVIVIDTDGARRSKWVGGEMTRALTTRRTLLVVTASKGDFDASHFHGVTRGQAAIINALRRIDEDPRSLEQGHPSKSVCDEVERYFTLRRRRREATALVLFVMLALGASARFGIAKYNQFLAGEAAQRATAMLANDPSGSLSQAVDSLDHHVTAEAMATAIEAFGRQPTVLARSAKPATRAGFASANVVLVGPSGVFETEGKRAKQRSPDATHDFCVAKGPAIVAWSIDASSLTVVRDGRPRVISLPGAVRAVSCQPGHSIVAALLESGVAIVDLESGGLRSLPMNPGVEHVRMISESKLAVAREQQIEIWNPQTLEQGLTLETSVSIDVWAWSPDGETAAVAHAGNLLIQPLSGSPVRLAIDGMFIKGLAFDANGEFLAVGGTERGGSHGGAAHVYAVSGEHLGTVNHSTGFASGVAFSPVDSGLLLTVSEDYSPSDNSARLWDWRKGRELARMDHEGPLQDFRWRDDGQAVVTVSRDRATLWMHDSMEATKKGRPIAFAAAMDRGSALVVRADGSEQVVARYRNDPPLAVPYSTPLGIALSPDSAKLALATGDGRIVLWSNRQRKELAAWTVPNLTGALDFDIGALSFDMMGQWLAAAVAKESRGELLTIELHSGTKRVVTLEQGVPQVLAFEASRTNRIALGFGTTGTVVILSAEGKPLQRARADKGVDVEALTWLPGEDAVIFSASHGDYSASDICRWQIEEARPRCFEVPDRVHAVAAWPGSFAVGLRNNEMQVFDAAAFELGPEKVEPWLRLPARVSVRRLDAKGGWIRGWMAGITAKAAFPMAFPIVPEVLIRESRRRLKTNAKPRLM